MIDMILSMEQKEKIIIRFNKFVDKISSKEGCWLWLGYKNEDGYGIFRYGKRMIGAHRVSWVLFKKNIEKGNQINHICDVRNCVNPEHLYEGTQQDNVTDMERKGRGNKVKGDSHWTHLYPEKVVRGDQHFFRLHPEKVARGDRHMSVTKPWALARGDRSGARTHPEKVSRGEKVHTAKLKEDQVVAIRKLYAEGVSASNLAKNYGVKCSTIYFIINYKTWKHVK